MPHAIPSALLHAIPSALLHAAESRLDSVPEHRRRTFLLRLERWWTDVSDGLATLYPPSEAAELAVRLIGAAASAFTEREDDLHLLDERRLLAPDWLQSPAMVGYSAYTERFADNLAGVEDRIGHLTSLGVRYLHLMPLLTPRDGDSDGGYAVADYRSVRPDLGTMDDLRALTRRLRAEDISLTLDFVVNHVADQHEWARRARAGEQRYRDYFHVFPDRTLPDAYEATLPEVFPDFAPGNFTWHPHMNAWVWTTFNSFQWDLDWSNPDVFAEYADLVFFLANAGVEVLRLDAIAFVWKEMGTNCQGRPQVHAITSVLKALARIACPATVFKAEAIVAPEELLAYLGQGRYTGKVSDLAYHNSLMVQIWSMLATQDVRLTAQALGALPPTPSTATWITYVRCHDDIGWAIADTDAAAAGLDGFAHRSFLADWYTGTFPGSPARGLTFQHNPATGDRRICGTTAQLTGLAAARDRHDEDAGALAVAAARLAHTIAYGYGGIPVIWSGDEVAALDDPAWAAEPGHEDDNRWSHRVRLSTADLTPEAGTPAAAMLAHLRHLAQVRASLPHLHAATPTYIGDVDDRGVLATSRPHPIGMFVGLYNVTPTPRTWPGERLGHYGFTDPVDALTGEAVRADGGAVTLPPYGALWIVERDSLTLPPA